MPVIIMGNMDKGKRNMLNSDRATNAFSASSMLFVSLRTYVAKVTRETKKGAQAQTKDVPAAR